ERRVVHRAVASGERGLGFRGHERRPRHRLDAAGDEEVAVPGDHGVAGTHDRGEPGCAEPVDGDAADRVGKTREQDGHARDVPVVLARLVRLRRDAGAVDGGADGERGEVVGPGAREPAAVAADGRAYRAQDHRKNSGSFPSSAATAARPRSPMSSVRSLTYIETKRSAVSASMPRPKSRAYAIASSRCSSAASIASRNTADTSSSRSTSRRTPTSPSGSGRPTCSCHHTPRSSSFVRPATAYVSWPS